MTDHTPDEASEEALRQALRTSMAEYPPAGAGFDRVRVGARRRQVARRTTAVGLPALLVLGGVAGFAVTRPTHPQSLRTVVVASPSVAPSDPASIAATPAPTASPRTVATTVATLPAPLPAGASGGPAQIPWPSVGPGWYLTLRSAGAASDQLALYDPDGGAYVISSWASSNTAGPSLEAWSPDGRSAVVLDGPYSPQAGTGTGSVDLVNLATGVRTAIEGLGNAASVAFTEPHGTELLVSIPDGSGAADAGDVSDTVERTTLSGSVVAVLATRAGSAFDAPDGTEVVLSGVSYQADMQVVSNAGGPTRSLVGTGMCQPLRFWDEQQLLASCTGVNSSATYLVLVDVDTGAIARLTPAHPAGSSDLGDVDAYLLDGALYSTAAGACGVLTVDRLSPDGAVTQIPVAHQGPVTELVGTVGDLLVVEAGPGNGPSGCSQEPLLETVNPITDVSRTVIPAFIAGSLLTYPEPAEN